MVTKEATDRNYPWLGFTDGHHELSHHAGVAEKNRKLREIDRYHISILGYMIEKMMTIEEAGGTTLLDNSMVCSAAESVTVIVTTTSICR